MTRPIRKLALPFMALTASLIMLSCSGDSTAPEEEAPGTKGPSAVSAIITPAGGGIVSATTASGAAVKLTFPPGAVKTPTEVTVRPLAPSAGAWATVALEPAGLVFYERFYLDITIPDGPAMTSARLLLRPDYPVYLATEVNGRTLTAALTFFGFSGDSTHSIAGVPSIGNTTPRAAGGGNNFSAAPVDCGQLSATAQAVFDGFVALGDFEGAIEAALTFAAMLDGGGCAQGQTWFDNAQQAVCDGYDAALQNAQSTPTTSYGDFVRQTDEIIKWFTLAQTSAAPCDPSATYLAAIDAEVTDFTQFFNQKLGTLTANDNQTFSNLKDEAVGAFDLHVRAATLGSLDASDKIYDDAFRPAVDQLRPIAYSMCQSDGWHYFLSRLTSTGFFAARDMAGVSPPRIGKISPAPSSYANFEDDDIFEDLQYCGSSINVSTKATSGGQIAMITMEGTAPGQKSDADTVVTPTRGSISLGGKLLPFSCWEGVKGDTEVNIELDGTNVLSLVRLGQANYLDTPAVLDVAQIAATAGITPQEGSTNDLVIIRHRPNCDDRMWGDTDYELFTTTLKWKNPTLDVAVTMADTVQARTSASVSVRVKVIDQLGQAGFFDGINVVLNVAGGTAALVSGTTDGQGYFNTSVTPDNPNLAAFGDALAAGLTVTATATSFEGATAQGVDNATVLACDAVDFEFREGGTGNHTKTLEWGHLKTTATAGAGQYSYATTEWIDDYAVYPRDLSLNGQDGFVYIKVHYKFTSTGSSDSHPAARVVIGPRNGYSSPFFWEQNYNTPGGTTQNVVEGDWEIPLSCTFGRSRAPMDVNCDAFARGTDATTNVTCEITWKGITKVTEQDGTVVFDYRICSGSGTDWRLPQ